MPYELALYRARLLEQFAQWAAQYKDNPLRQDAYLRAARLHQVLRAVLPVEDDAPVPADSVLREFIGAKGG